MDGAGRVAGDMDGAEAAMIADTGRACCPFKTTPGRLAGQWTNCIHGLLGRQAELLQELAKIEDAIVKWQMENPRSGAHNDGSLCDAS